MSEAAIFVDLGDSDHNQCAATDSDSSQEEYEQHPATIQGWDKLDTNEREQKLYEYRTRDEKKRSCEHKASIKASTSQSFDWTLKPRAIAHVSGNPNLKAGDRFQTKQEIQLRVPEICNNLHRIPRWKRSETDPLDARAGTSIGYLCARSWSQSHDFAAKVSFTKGIWTCKKASIAEVSRRTSIDASARRSCPFTVQHLSRLFSRTFARIRRLEQTQYELAIVKEFVRYVFLTPSIIQQTSEKAKYVIFGDPVTNIHYIQHVSSLALCT